MTTHFTIQFPDQPAQPFANYGLTKPALSIASQRESKFTFTADGTAMDANALAAEGEIVKVLYGSEPFFQGRLFRVPRQGSATREAIEYQVLDAWNDFQRVVYQQQWNVMVSRDEDGNPTTAAQYIGELILGMDLDGNALTSGQVIELAVQYAITCGANCQIGEIGVAAPVPFDQVTDLPVSEVIRRMLRWTPDAVTWFDYSMMPPGFNVTRRGNCAAVGMPLEGAVEKLEVQALPDLVPPCCIINYIQTNTSNDGPSEVTVTPDVWPLESSPTQLGAMIMTCRLAGAQSTYQRQPVKTTNIPLDNSAGDTGGPAGDATILWWQRKVPWLQTLGSPGTYNATDVGAQLMITNVYGVYELGQGADDGTGTVQVDSGEYPNELTVGTVSAWMDVQWAKTAWSALVSYNYPSDTEDYTDQDWDAVNVFGPDEGSGSSVQVLVTAKAMATNAITNTYSQLSGYSAGEPLPVGLAQQIYSCVSTLQYKGSYTIVGQDASPWSLGIALNITGGRAEWEGMNALVQQIEQDLETGRTTLGFGPYGHLTLQDLMERLRATRTRVEGYHMNERQTGEARSGSPIDGAAQGPADGGGSPPNNNEYLWIGDIGVQENDSGSQPATWDSLIGYGQSSFTGEGGIANAAPIECFEISIGNDGSDWDGPDDGYGSVSLLNATSLICGDETPANDGLLLGRTDGDGNGGSFVVTPYGPSILLSPNLDGSVGENDQSIEINLEELSMQIEDTSQDEITLEIDTDSGSASLDLVNAQSGAENYIDESSITIQAGSGDSAVIDINGDDGANVTIDTDDLNGGSAYFQQVTVCVGGVAKTAYVLMTEPQ